MPDQTPSPKPTPEQQALRDEMTRLRAQLTDIAVRLVDACAFTEDERDAAAEAAEEYTDATAADEAEAAWLARFYHR